MMKLGIQLYTLRTRLEQDFRGTLREVANLGFDAVEFAWNFGAMTPEELAAFLRECKLACCGIHSDLATLADPDSGIFSYANALGAKYVTASACFGPEQTEFVLAAAEIAGKNAAAHRCTFTYHNHAQELKKDFAGERALDRFYRLSNPETVRAELDVCWLTRGGADPAAEIRRYARRLPQLHLKDMNFATGEFTELGKGDVNLAACVAAARDTVCEWLIYEQDSCSENPLDSAAYSIETMKKLNQFRP